MADGMRPIFGQIQSSINDARNSAASRVSQITGNMGTDAMALLRNIDSNIQRLANILTPNPLNSQLTFGNLAPGATMDPTACRLQSGIYNCITGTVTGVGAQINVYFNSADVNVQPPDAVFLAGYPSSTLHFPSTSMGQVLIVSVGSAAASGKITFMSY